MKDNTKEKAPNIPTEKELLEFGIFYKKDNRGYPIYQYYDSFYGILPNGVISKIRMKY